MQCQLVGVKHLFLSSSGITFRRRRILLWHLAPVAHILTSVTHILLSVAHILTSVPIVETVCVCLSVSLFQSLRHYVSVSCCRRTQVTGLVRSQSDNNKCCTDRCWGRCGVGVGVGVGVGQVALMVSARGC